MLYAFVLRYNAVLTNTDTQAPRRVARSVYYYVAQRRYNEIQTMHAVTQRRYMNYGAQRRYNENQTMRDVTQTRYMNPPRRKPQGV